MGKSGTLHREETLLDCPPCLAVSCTSRCGRAKSITRTDGSGSWYLETIPTKVRKFVRRLGFSDANDEGDDWRPAGLRFWTVSLLILLLALVMAALVTIYTLYKGPGLYESVFTYQRDINIKGRRIPSLAPFSVIPTLLATIIKLW